MKRSSVLLLVALSVWLAAPAMAGDDDPKMTADEKQMRQDLERAQERLEEAAREVARLSQKLSGGAMERMARYFADTGRRAMLGITIGDESEDKESGPAGVRIYGVSPGGPAEAAGLQAGDVIVSVNSQSMGADAGGHADSKLLKFMKTVEPGDALTVDYLRDGQQARTTVVTKAFEPEAFAFSFDDDDKDMFQFQGRPGMPGFVLRMDDHDHGGEPFAGPFAGHHLELVSMTPGLGAYFGTEEGLLVVRADGAADFPLQEGDVIVSIDGERVTRAGRVLERLAELKPSRSLAVEIVRQRQTLTIQLQGRAGGDRGQHMIRKRIEERWVEPGVEDTRILDDAAGQQRPDPPDRD